MQVLTMSIISRWMARLGITGIYVGRSVRALFIGLAPDHYVVGSEIYGFVESASRYLKMDGAKAVPGISGTTQGQIVVLQQASEGDLPGVQVMTYEGTSIVLSPNDVKETELTSRDIDRQSYPHYFSKKICEAPIGPYPRHRESPL